MTHNATHCSFALPAVLVCDICKLHVSGTACIHVHVSASGSKGFQRHAKCANALYNYFKKPILKAIDLWIRQQSRSTDEYQIPNLNAKYHQAIAFFRRLFSQVKFLSFTLSPK